MNCDVKTIFAISSGIGKAGVVVFRISGHKAFEVIDLFQIENIKNLEFGRVYLRTLFTNVSNDEARIFSKSWCAKNNSMMSANDTIDTENGDFITDKELNQIIKYPIDKALLLFFKNPKSFTGENCVEIHTHGSYAVIEIISKILATKFSPALPGEFTKRALLNGKMSLYEVEGLNDLLAAKTWSQHKLANIQFSGIPNKQHLYWKDQLYQILAYFESYIDFPDEDIPEEVLEKSMKLIENLVLEFDQAMKTFDKVQKIQNGIKVVIVGKPNVGKSSLINLLSKRKVAIVSEIAGTTRDVIESYIDLEGYQINLLDTAGLNANSTDKIEQIGIDLAILNLKNADIRLIVLDAAKINQDLNEFGEKEMIDARILSTLQENSNNIILLNKIDLLKPDEINLLLDRISKYLVAQKISTNNFTILKSCIKELNFFEDSSQKDISHLNQNEIQLTQLIDQIKNLCKQLEPQENPILFNLRHKQYIEDAILSLKKVLEMKINSHNIIFLAEEVRHAIFSLEIIIGRLDIDEILGKIFSEFCIGK